MGGSGCARKHGFGGWYWVVVVHLLGKGVEGNEVIKSMAVDVVLPPPLPARLPHPAIMTVGFLSL